MAEKFLLRLHHHLAFTKRRAWRNGLVFLCLLVTSSCIEPFDLPEGAETPDFLVVDGQLNVEEGSGTVYLTRTQNLAATEAPTPELQAEVTVEPEEGPAMLLAENDNGVYSQSGLELVLGRRYRLRVRTRNGKEYLSEFMKALPNPEIDSLTWHVERGGVLVKANTHDPDNNTWYYRWEFDETYAYTAAHQSGYVWDTSTGRVVQRTDDIFRCWKTDPATTILVGTSDRLSQDVIRDFPLVFHPGNTQVMRIKYSVLVRQYAIGREEYDYWQMMKKNTESVGTLFDPQPSQVTGNLTCLTDPAEPVLGHFGAYQVRQKRLYITPEELEPYDLKPHFPTCEKDTVLLSEFHSFVNSSLIVAPIYDGLTLLGYTMTTRNCADCRLQGGTNVKPDFM